MDAAVPQNFRPENEREREYFASGLSSAQSSLDQWVDESLHVLRRASHPPGGRWRRRRDCWIERGISARQKITN
jgi:hypothetical protein